ncbi:MAG: class I SAM-dependent methyltransferase [Anaerolineales bacterium]
MQSEIVERLLTINRGFYQSFAEPFRATRGRLQPGVVRALESVRLDANVLDLGCAHGVLAEELWERGFSGRYVGLDASRPLLESISEQLQPPRYQFELADLDDEQWSKTAQTLLSASTASGLDGAGNSTQFDWAFAFAVLHHLPTSDLRRSTVDAIKALLSADGRVAISVWDFLASPRLQDRIVPWETVDLGEDEVDEGDYLVDWREGGSGVRYVHHYTEEELNRLAEDGGYRVAQEYRSDGENGRLGLYQIWEVA